MFTTRLSSVITGCGGNETTRSPRSMSGLTLTTNGTITPSPASRGQGEAPRPPTSPARRPPSGRWGGPARSADDPGWRLRQEAHRPDQPEEHPRRDDDEDDHTSSHHEPPYSDTSAVAPSIFKTSTRVPGSNDWSSSYGR